MRTLYLLVTLLFVQPLARSAPPPLLWQPQHPQIHAARTTIERDEDSNQLYVVVAVDIVDDGAGWTEAGATLPTCAAAYTVIYRSALPPAPYDLTWTLSGGTPCVAGSQLPRFAAYLGAALGCADVDLHFYDPPAARNPRSPQSIVSLAANLSQLRAAGPFSCTLPPLPPLARPDCQLPAAFCHALPPD